MSTNLLIFWVAGLSLQICLLPVLFYRGLLGRFRAFSLLIVFYSIRALAMYAMFSRVSSGNYFYLFHVLSYVDVCLQVIVAAEIAFRVLRDGKGGPERVPRRKVWLFAILPAALFALFATGIISLLNIPLDRGALLNFVLMMALVVWMTILHCGGPARRIAVGFAVFGAMSQIADILRHIALTYRNSSLWVGASQAKSWAWVAVLVYWLVVFGVGPSLPPQRKPASYPA